MNTDKVLPHMLSIRHLVRAKEKQNKKNECGDALLKWYALAALKMLECLVQTLRKKCYLKLALERKLFMYLMSLVQRMSFKRSLFPVIPSCQVEVGLNYFDV